MKLSLVSGTLPLLALATSLAVNLPSQQQSPTGSARNSARQATKSADAGTGKRKIPCKTPENASLCYWTHGRLSLYLSWHEERAPWRIWKVGTKHIFYVCNGPSRFPPLLSHDCTDPEFPANLDKIYKDPQNWERSFVDDTRYSPADVFADFEICPLEPEKRGEMQAACIESAKITFVEK